MLAAGRSGSHPDRRFGFVAVATENRTRFRAQHYRGQQFRMHAPLPPPSTTGNTDTHVAGYEPLRSLPGGGEGYAFLVLDAKKRISADFVQVVFREKLLN